MAHISIRQFLTAYDRGEFDSPDRATMCRAGWYDWFCTDKSLKNRLDKLVAKLRTVATSPKIDPDKNYVFFKNNCPMAGKLYDDFRICCLEDNDVLFTVIPKSGFDSAKGRAEVWGKDNAFAGPLVAGTWDDVVAFFHPVKRVA